MLLPRLLLLALSPSPAAVSSPGSRAGLHVGRWTTPPKRCPSSMVTDGPLLANGDAGAAVGGFRMSANGKQLQQSYYIGKMDFWTHQNVGPPGNTEWYSHVAPGHVTLRFGGGTPLEKDSVQAVIENAQARLGNSGRLVIRPSGTEPLIRVMAEGEDEVLVTAVVNDVADAIQRAAT